jgi:iron complex outermembrane receptor protein
VTTDATFKGHLAGLKNQVSVGFDINSTSFTHTNNTYNGSFSSVNPYSFDPGSYASGVGIPAFLPRFRARAAVFSLLRRQAGHDRKTECAGRPALRSR